MFIAPSSLDKKIKSLFIEYVISKDCIFRLGSFCSFANCIFESPDVLTGTPLTDMFISETKSSGNLHLYFENFESYDLFIKRLLLPTSSIN